MSRLTETFENVERSFDDFEKEGMSLEDFLVKTKFNFNSGKCTFSSKSKFALGEKTGVAHEYTLKHKCSKMTAEFNHVAAKGTTTLEADGKLFSQNDLSVEGFVKSTISTSQSVNYSSDAKVQVRVHHKNNAMLVLGVENWNTSSGAPTNFVAQGSYGHVVDGTRLTFNGQLNFDSTRNFLPLVRLFAKGQRGDFTGLLLANVNRDLVTDTNDSTKSTVENNIDVSLRFSHVCCPKSRVGGTLIHDINSKETNATFAGSLALDRVKLNAKVSTDRTVTAGITSVHDDLTLNFVARSALGSSTEKIGETETHRNWLNYRFGLSAEFNRI